MPHDGLMVETELGPVAGPRQRARLHLRGGKRRLRQGKTAAGIVTLYDAVTAAMEAYAASGERRLRTGPGENLTNEKVLYRVLVRSAVLDGRFDFDRFDLLTEKALSGEIEPFDYGPVLAGVESVLTQLGVIPFDEGQLPREDPKTF
ncbi:MAG: hypothetical protein A2010_04110 [Nitrospirae bacterium GWD2_57_9]|nr:MAG: hypothetical protein A2010_04110 [Nitrospirae bacterium GWD2_57_9]